MSGKKTIHIDKDELYELCESGLTEYEIAKRFNCSRRVITRRKSEYGIVYGRGHTPANKKANHDPSRRGRGRCNFQRVNDPLEKREADFIERLASDPRTKMYEYVGGYKTKRDKLTIRCRKCGELKTTSPSALFSNKYDHHVCFNCMRIEREKAKKERTQAWKEHEAAELEKDKVCETCGRIYHSTSDTSKYCSPKCKRKRKDSCHRRRARRYGVEYDPSVTWQSLSKKLGHCNCEICGEPCDPNDKSWGGNSGPLHPTVDCIVAMKNGGGYVWGNVQLAHAICNSAKRDLIDDGEIEEAVASIGKDGGSHAQRHATRTVETACA